MAYNEEEIAGLLTERFDGITVTIQRERRLWLESQREGFLEVLEFIHDDLGFDSLCTVTGIDGGEVFQLIYHLAHECGIVLNAKVSAPRENPVFDTATNIYKGGIFYELEARNLLGLTVLGIPEDIVYPLPDNWPQGNYPLRKDWVGLPEKDEPAQEAAEAGEAKAGEAKAATPDALSAQEEVENG